MAIHDVEHCDCHEVHKELVTKVMNHMPDEDELYDLAELFKLIGDPTRIKILFCISKKEMCVIYINDYYRDQIDEIFEGMDKIKA